MCFACSPRIVDLRSSRTSDASICWYKVLMTLYGITLYLSRFPARPGRPPSERQVGRLKVMQNYLDRQYRVARYVLELSPIQYDQTRLLITKKLLKGRALKFEALGTLVTAMKAHLLFL